MPTLAIPLKDILTDAADPVDLTMLPEDEAIAQIKGIYGFLASEVEVAIHNGVAVITLPDAKASKTGQAFDKIAQATRAARGGNYRQAIRYYEEALKVLPDHTDARRDLAMCLFEMGNYDAAKQHLIRVLQLDPSDASAFLVLGNLYYQAEQDYGSAERYYAGALDLEPDNPYVLNSYAGLKGKRKQYAEAVVLFERAIDLLPGYPNPRYGLALCLLESGALDAAIATLDDLFAATISEDPRHAPVYGEARRLYAEARRRRAQANGEEVMARVRETMDAYTADTGIGVRVVEDQQLTTAAKVELAWRYQRPYHLIRVKGRTEPYMLAHEFEHILLSSEARALGRNRLYAVSQQTVEEQVQRLERDLRKVQNRRGVDARAAATYGRMLVEGMLNQLYNGPLDMVIDSRLHARCPWLRDHQFGWMAADLTQNLRGLNDRQVRETTPVRIWQANTAMNTATALFVDDLFSGATAFGEAYAAGGMLANGQRLFALFEQAWAGFTPGDECDLVDAWTAELGLTGQYYWTADTDPDPDVGDAPAAPAARPSRTRPAGVEGPTNPALLHDPGTQMAATLHMVSALERFEGMSQNAVTQIAGEIAILGITGIDYASPAPQYTLRFLPGEEFTGLQLLCLQYVGFQIAFPETDTQIPLGEAYAAARKLYEAKRKGDP